MSRRSIFNPLSDADKQKTTGGVLQTSRRPLDVAGAGRELTVHHSPSRELAHETEPRRRIGHAGPGPKRRSVGTLDKAHAQDQPRR